MMDKIEFCLWSKNYKRGICTFRKLSRRISQLSVRYFGPKQKAIYVNSGSTELRIIEVMLNI